MATVREIATSKDLYESHIDPQGNDRGAFDRMSTEEKMRTIVEMFPDDIDEDDDEGRGLILVRELAKTHHDDSKRERLVARLNELVDPLCQSPTYNQENSDEHTHLQDWLDMGDYYWGDGEKLVTIQDIANEWDESSAE